MRHILEEYGELIISVTGGVFIVGIIAAFILNGGTINEWIYNFLFASC